MLLASSAVIRDLPNNSICKGVPCVPFKTQVSREQFYGTLEE